jgi:uroporphyrinogen-III decarboxylase
MGDGQKVPALNVSKEEYISNPEKALRLTIQILRIGKFNVAQSFVE